MEQRRRAQLEGRLDVIIIYARIDDQVVDAAGTARSHLRRRRLHLTAPFISNRWR